MIIYTKEGDDGTSTTKDIISSLKNDFITQDSEKIQPSSSSSSVVPSVCTIRFNDPQLVLRNPFAFLADICQNYTQGIKNFLHMSSLAKSTTLPSISRSTSTSSTSSTSTSTSSSSSSSSYQQIGVQPINMKNTKIYEKNVIPKNVSQYYDIYDMNTEQYLFSRRFYNAKYIGSGSFGIVLKAKSRSDGFIYAIKRSKEYAKGYSDRRRLFAESFILSYLNNQPNVRFINTFYPIYESQQQLCTQVRLLAKQELIYCTYMTNQTMEENIVPNFNEYLECIMLNLPPQSTVLDINTFYHTIMTSLITEMESRSLLLSGGMSGKDYIVHAFDSWIEQQCPYVYTVFEWCGGGSLQQILQRYQDEEMKMTRNEIDTFYLYNRKQLFDLFLTKKLFCSSFTVLQFLRQILEALTHTHTWNISHCDIKPDNILLTTCGPVKPQQSCSVMNLLDVMVESARDVTNNKSKYIKDPFKVGVPPPPTNAVDDTIIVDDITNVDDTTTNIQNQTVMGQNKNQNNSNGHL